MQTASNVLGYFPWVAAITVFVATGSILRALAMLTLLSITLSLPAIFLAHAARRRIRKNEGPLVDRGPAASGLALSYLGLATGLVFFFWFPYGDPLGGRAANEASAVGSLRSIYRAADNYKLAHPTFGFPQSLENLLLSREATGADWKIDAQIASGQKSGYRFTYVPKKNTDGRVDAYLVLADPTSEGRTGTRHFFVDQSGALRFTFKTQANAQSEILQ
jgi:hypothetical protein